MTPAHVLKSCISLLMIIIFCMGLIILAFFLTTSDMDIFALVNALEERGLPSSLLYSLGICFAVAFLALLAGFPLGIGIAGMGRSRRWALGLLILFALLPVSLIVSWDAAGLGLPYELCLMPAAASWVALLAVVTAKPKSNLSSAAELSGVPRITILTRIQLPRLLPLCAAAMFGSFILLLLFEGTVFSAVICIFEQSEKQGNILPALLTLVLLTLPLLLILFYIYMWYTRPETD